MLVGEKLFGNLTEEKVKAIIAKLKAGENVENDTPLTYTEPLLDGVVSVNFLLTEAKSLKVAEERGAYKMARKAVLDMTPDQIREEVKAAGLRGQGGAGFPAGVKWGFVPKDIPGPRYLCVNGDESEPGTCKDREIMRRDPHRLIEGIIAASKAIGVHTAYVYIRREFYEPRQILDAAIKEAYAVGYLGKNIFGSDYNLDIYTHPGAGAYICGEETGLIESLEGKKGWPRIKPPFPAVVGLFGRPTIVNNIETISNIPYILQNGSAKFRQRGTEKSPGTKLFGISGHVKRPGVHELPMGFSLKDLIYGIAGGIRDGRALKGVIPGGSSVQILKPDEIDIALDFESVAKAGSSLGSGAAIVMDDTVFMPWALEIISRFYAHESCGQCTPCREGTAWAYKIIRRMNQGRGRKGDIETLLDLANNIEGQTICPLGAAAAWPIQAMLKKFPEEFESLIKS
ncbi:MAG: NADH-quinone oxidoreductase subunit NuoF [Calditrichaeota bacterium]|nr:NADH-quinone oxidoreductase subunit NuoF [Calditrichota bacterium]